jgi:hypothetical protein
VSDAGDLVLQKRIEVWTEVGVPVSAECKRAWDADEVHVLRSDVIDTYHELWLRGLLADSHYQCEVVAGDARANVSFDTESLPDEIPALEVTEDTGASAGAYTLVSHMLGGEDDPQIKLLIVDPEGRVRWYYFLDRDAADIDAQLIRRDQVLFGGGYEVNPTIIDLSHNVLYVAPNSESGFTYNHHTEELANGDILSLAGSPNQSGETTWLGFAIEVRDPATDALTWRWDSQQAVDAGTLSVPEDDDDDPYHANSVSLVTDDEGEAAYVSLRQQSNILRIDVATGEITWRLGPGGDFQLVDEEGDPAPASQWFYGQHAPELHLPRVLVYDNGWGRPDGAYSRLAELEIDVGERTARVSTSWTGDGWYEPIWGDIDELPNGNLLGTRAHCPPCGMDAQRTSIDEVDRDTGELVWQLTFLDGLDASYRSQRVDGCLVFSNAAYCPALLGDG